MNKRCYFLLIICLTTISIPGFALEGWSGAGQNVGYVYRIATSDIPDLVYCGSPDSFYRSENAGCTWSKKEDGNFRFLISSGTTPEILYAGSEHYWIAVSEDHGDTWLKVDAPHPLIHIYSGVVNPSNPREAFFGGGWGIRRMYQSNGEWQIDRIFKHSEYAYHHQSLVMFPDNPDILYTATREAGIFRLQRVENDVWTRLEDGFTPAPGVIINAMCRDTINPGMLYVGTANHKVYHVDRNFTHWDLLPPVPGNEDDYITNILFSTFGGQSALFVESMTQVFLWKNDQWKDLHAPFFPHQYAQNLCEQPESGDIIMGSQNGCFVYLRTLNTWQVRNRGLQTIRFEQVSFHPRDSRDILVATEGTGIFRSRNSGVTWIQSNSGLPDLSTRSLIRDPDDPDTVFASATISTVVSHDGGNSWTPIGTIAGTGAPLNNVRNLFTIDHNGSREMFAGTYFASEESGLSVLYRSEDDGQTWTAVPGPTTGGTIHALIQDRSNPARLYATAENGSNVGYYWFSDDFGRSFTQWTPAGIPGPSACTMAFGLIQAPDDPDVFFLSVTGNGIYKSTDHGESFTRVSTDSSYYWTQLVLKQRPGDDLLMANANQVQRPWPELLISRDSGDTWNWSGAFDPETWISTIAADPDRDRVWVLNRNGEIWQSDSAATDWTKISRYYISLPFQVNDVAVHPENPDILYVASEGEGVWKSVDAGRTWSLASTGIDPDFMFVRTIDIDEDAPNRLLIGAANGDESVQRVYESLDDAGQWHQKNAADVFSANIVDLDIVETAAVTNPIWLVTYGNGPFLSIDGGTTWESRPITPAPPDLLMTSVTHTGNSAENDEPWIFVSSHGGGGVFIWDPDGGTFLERSNGLPGGTDKMVNFVAADPNRYDVLWAGTPYGLYVTRDLGLNWLPAFSIDFQPVTSIIPRHDGVTFDRGDIFYFNRNAGIFRSQAGFRPDDWHPMETGLQPGDLDAVTCLIAAGSPERHRLFLGARSTGESDNAANLAYPLSVTMKPLGVNLEFHQRYYESGDLCTLNAILTNPGPDNFSNIPLVIIMDLAGQLYWWPSWNTAGDAMAVDIPAGVTTLPIFSFPWPAATTSGAVDFYAALIDPATVDILGNLDWERIGW